MAKAPQGLRDLLSQSSYFFVIRHDLRHGNRPYHYRQHYTTLHYNNPSTVTPLRVQHTAARSASAGLRRLMVGFLMVGFFVEFVVVMSR